MRNKGYAKFSGASKVHYGRCVSSVYVVVQFYPWFNFIFFCFKLIIIHYHTQKQEEIKFKPSIKLNHNIYNKCVQRKLINYPVFKRVLSVAF